MIKLELTKPEFEIIIKLVVPLKNDTKQDPTYHPVFKRTVTTLLKKLQEANK